MAFACPHCGGSIQSRRSIRAATNHRGATGAKVSAGMRMSPEARAAREGQMVALRGAGVSLDEIGQAFGVTRERARQLLKRNGVVGTTATLVDPLRLLAAIRRPETMTVSQAADAIGASPNNCIIMLGKLGMRDAVQRLLHWRRDRAIIASFVGLAEQIGHTPTAGDVNAARIPGLVQSNIQRRFGGLQRLARRAGLAVNPTGRPSPSPLSPTPTGQT